MPEALPFLPLLAEITAYFFAWGFCILVALVVAALFAQVNAALGWVPWLGPRVQAPLHSIEQKITSELGKAVGWLDHRMALTWYKMAHLAEWIGHEIAANAGLMANLAALVWNPLSVPAWQALLKGLHLSIGGATATVGGTVHTLTRPITGELTALEKWVGGRVRTIDHTIEVTLPRDIAGLRARAGKLEKLYSDLYKAIRRTEALFATGAFAAAVAIALSTLGLGWTRCSAVGRVGRTLCGLGPQLIEDLLAVGLEVLIVADLCQIANAMEAAAAAVEPELEQLVNLTNFICLAGGASLPSAIVDADRTGGSGHPTAIVSLDLAA